MRNRWQADERSGVFCRFNANTAVLWTGFVLFFVLPIVAVLGAADCVSGYAELGAEIGRLVETKQRAYGDSFGRAGEVMRVLYPNGVSDEQLDDALAVVRVVDKLFRIATDRDALGESPWRDIAGYALLGAARAEDRRVARFLASAPPSGVGGQPLVDAIKAVGVGEFDLDEVGR